MRVVLVAALLLTSSVVHAQRAGPREVTAPFASHPPFGSLATTSSAPAAPAVPGVTPETQGLTDRTSYEGWYASLNGDHQQGALFWVGRRSKPQPISCLAADPAPTPDFVAGCQEAQRRLALPDARRRTEPAYRRGWNSFVAGGTPVAARSSQTPASSDPPPLPDSAIPPLDPAWRNQENMVCRDPRAALAEDGIIRLFQNIDPAAQYAYRQCVQRRETARTVIADWEHERDRVLQQTHRAREARQREIERRDRERAAAAQVAAEQSSGNYCATPAVAKELLSEFGQFPVFKCEASARSTSST